MTEVTRNSYPRLAMSFPKPDSTLPETIKAARLRRKWRQSDLAHHATRWAEGTAHPVTVQQSCVNKIEMGRALPRLPWLRAVAGALGFDVIEVPRQVTLKRRARRPTTPAKTAEVR